jgi:hypothetical protein
MSLVFVADFEHTEYVVASSNPSSDQRGSYCCLPGQGVYAKRLFVKIICLAEQLKRRVVSGKLG